MSHAFRAIVLGCTGGPRENNLSGYLIYPTAAPDQVIALDAGTLLAGIEVAYNRGNCDDFTFSFPSLTPVGEILIKKIKAYLISHAHLDHVCALVINSQVDDHKPILGTDHTIDDLRDYIFNGETWPNYGSEGKKPLNRYHYQRLTLHQETAILHTEMKVVAYPLSHPHDYASTAFLIEYQGNYILYCGDTSPDLLEPKKRLEELWKAIAPLIKKKKLAAILLECSVPDENSDQVIYGHLNPKMMMQEFHALEQLVQAPLKGLNVVVTHRKENLYANHDMQQRIEKQLLAMNDQHLNLIFPTQGDKLIF